MTTPSRSRTDTPMSAPAPTEVPMLNGQIIGQAERATRAVLDVLLARSATSFEQWVALNVVGTGSAATTDALLDRLVGGLRLDRDGAAVIVDEARSAGLLAGDAEMELTSTGQERFDDITAGIAGIVDRLYGGLAVDDLVVARRALETITARATRELAAVT